jgi:uncharacterized protein YjbI with pentapeptide repeats/pSer/pThr/pTyr-binding forkhead associated (FHA) protein
MNVNEPSASWIAILTLHGESGFQKDQKNAEPYILSKKEATFIGRSNDCQIVLRPKYATASRYHAKIEMVNLDGELVWQICDLGTPNGTFVNDQKIKDCQRLKSGDKVMLGKPKGANFLFEWNAREIEELNEIFRKKHQYDETIVPGIDYDSSDEQTQFFADNNNLDKPLEQPQKRYGDSERPKEESNEYWQPRQQRSGLNNVLFGVLPKGFLALLFLLLLSYFVYQIASSLESQKGRNESLRAYIDSISKLLLDKKLGSLDPLDIEARKARESANGQTLTTLKVLNGQSRGALLRFLHGAKLVKIEPQKLSQEWQGNAKPLTFQGQFQLSAQDRGRKELSYVRSFRMGSFTANLQPILLINQSEFSQGQLRGSFKTCGNPGALDQRGAACAGILSSSLESYERPFLTPIQLSGTDLTGVILKDAPLERINLEGAYLSRSTCKPNLSGNFWEDTFVRGPANWFSAQKCTADFSGAGLQDARLFRAVLMGANLNEAKLDYADLRQADLRDASLKGVSWQGAVLTGACYIADNWQERFPTKGPDGKPFDPVAAGMKPVSQQQSNLNNPAAFQECKNVVAAQPQ